MLTFGTNKRYDFIFGQQNEVPNDYARILIDSGYARKIGIVESIKDAVVNKNIASSEIENKAILSDDLENKDSDSGRRGRGRGRPKKTDE